MPRLSYPNPGRVASARTKQDLEGDKSNSIKLVDQVGDTHPELDTPDVRDPVSSQDDASEALQKQLEAMRESERIQRERNAQLVQEREEALRRANDREAENTRLKRTTFESQTEAIASSLAAATAEADSAQRDVEKALELGDAKGQADAYRRLSRAEANIIRLEDGKAALEAQAQQAAQRQAQTPQDPIDTLPMPELARTWLKTHREYVENPRKNAQIQKLHWDVIDEGHEPYSRGYFESIETHLGMRQRAVAAQETEQEEPEHEGNSSMVSAPVSREVPTSTRGERPGRVTLTVAQKEAAKISGVTEKEYAENLLRLRQDKLNGLYGGQP